MLALAGLLLLGWALVSVEDPRDWLDRNTTSVGSDEWTAGVPPLVLADRLADAVEPRSRVVEPWGVALRYAGGTVTVTSGTAEGTSAIYFDSRRRVVHTYSYGRWGSRGFEPVGIPGTAGTPDNPTANPLTQTRRAEDFRGGGPGGGK